MKTTEIIENKKEEIKELLEQGFGWKQVAKHIGIKESSIKNKMANFFLKKAGFEFKHEYKRNMVNFSSHDKYVDYSKSHNVGAAWQEDTDSDEWQAYEYFDIN